MTSQGVETCPKMCYPFRMSTIFDKNKFIGILPFGERKLEVQAVKKFFEQINETNLAKVESPFRLFVLEMT